MLFSPIAPFASMIVLVFVFVAGLLVTDDLLHLLRFSEINQMLALGSLYVDVRPSFHQTLGNGNVSL